MCHFLREIFLPSGIGIRLIVGIAIFLAVAHLFHQFGRRITQMYRHIIVRPIASIGHRCFKRGVDSITFRRTGQIDNRLGNGALALCRPYAGKTVPGRNRHLHGARIGITDIFGCNRQTAARDVERIATGGNNACIPVERSIWRTAPHGFV
ncbi:hypothetical protein D3C72_1421840 [compost metagenome]